MSVQTSITGKGTKKIIKVVGHFTFDLHDDFRRAYEIIRNEIKEFYIDLSQVSYMDSASLGMLLVFRDKMIIGKKKYTILTSDNHADEILKLVDFDKLFNVQDYSKVYIG